MKRALLGLVAVALLVGTALPAASSVPMEPEVRIQINGVDYEGLWAYIGDRPYVGVESFGSALGFPRQHNIKGWCLGPEEGPCDVSPLELAVEAKGTKLPTVRFAGATMVDLKTALGVLDIPLHYNVGSRSYQVGNPYLGEDMKGARYRWHALHYDWHLLGRRHFWERRGEWFEVGSDHGDL